MRHSIFYIVCFFATLVAAGGFRKTGKPYSQEFNDNFNLLKYTGGIGPYTVRRGVGISRDPPSGCRVEQVAMLHRHGERFPLPGDAKRHAETLVKIFQKRGNLQGSIEFANRWQPFADGNTAMNGEESEYGNYAGLGSAYVNGLEYRQRYKHIYDPETVQPFFAAAHERVIMTARQFGKGFMGFNYTDNAAVQIIPKTRERGADSLAPQCSGKYPSTCANYSGDNYEEFQRAARRLNQENGLNLTARDARNLLSMASFELNVRGDTPWAEVFTPEEWYAHNYLKSADFYCNSGPGDFASNSIGTVYLNSTRALLNQGPKAALPLAFSFTHDTFISPVVGLLGFASDAEFDPTKVNYHAKWDAADIVPQSARLVFERLVCDDSNEVLDEFEWANRYPMAFTGSNSTEIAFGESRNTTYSPETGSFYEAAQNATSGKDLNVYIRVVLNDAVEPLPTCNSGPGKSCPLGEFNTFVDNLIAKYEYNRNCGFAGQGFPESLGIFWNWNSSTHLNEPHYPIGYQAGITDGEGNPDTYTD